MYRSTAARDFQRPCVAVCVSPMFINLLSQHGGFVAAVRLWQSGGTETATSLTTYGLPYRIRSARILPVEGACITPCPLKPLAQKKPGTSSTGPRMQ